MARTAESKHEQVHQKLIGELKSLRTAVRETAEGFMLSKEGEIETLLDYFQKLPPGSLESIARPWMREARALKLKPAKGRLKDLKKIDTILHDLLNYVIDSDDSEEFKKPAGKQPRSGKKTTVTVEPEGI